MRKKTWQAALLCVVLALSAVMMFACAPEGGDGGTGDESKYTDYAPEKTPGGGQFDYDGNYAPPELTIDGKDDDEQWAATPELATFGKEGNAASVKVFRGTSALFFYFDVKDNNLLTLGNTNDDSVTKSDSIELYIDSKADGGAKPRSDDYQINLAIHGKTRIMQGAGNQWGNWNGLVDYEVDLKGGTLNDGTANDTGYSVEVMVPYAQIGIERDDTIAVAFGQVDKSLVGSDTEASSWYGWTYKGTFVEPQTISNYIFLDKDGKLTSRGEQGGVVIPDEIKNTRITSGKDNVDDWNYYFLFMEHKAEGVQFTAYSKKEMTDGWFILLYLDFDNDATTTGWAYGATDYQVKLYGDCNVFYMKSENPWWKTDHASADKLTAVKTEKDGLYSYSLVLPYDTFGYTASENIGFAVLQASGDNNADYSLLNDNSFYFDGASAGDVAVQQNFVRLAPDDTLYRGLTNGPEYDPSTATLSGVTLAGAALASFDSGVFTGYTHQFDYGVVPTADMIAAEKTNAASTTEIGVDTTAKKISITVKSANNKVTKVYEIAYTNAAQGTLSQDATLSAITIDGVSLEGFAPATMRYSYAIAYDADPADLVIVATPTHSGATASVARSTDGMTVTITVTAEDTSVTAEYRIDITLDKTGLAGKGYNINFADPADVKEAAADEFYAKVDRTTNTTGIRFDLVGFGDFSDGEFLTLILHTGEDKGGWGLDATDIMVRVTPQGDIYYKSGLASFWGWRSTQTGDSKFSTSATVTKHDRYFTVSFTLLYDELATIGADTAFGMILAECKDNGTQADMILYNADPWSNMCRLDGTAIGDPAAQSSYIQVAADGSLSLK